MDIVKELQNYLPFKIEDNSKLTEIRIRKNSKVIYVIDGKSVLSNDFISTKDFEDIFMKMCDYSVYSHIHTLVNGYITLKCGARVGVCGTALYNNNELHTIKDVMSLNIRIPRQLLGCSLDVLDRLSLNTSILVVGMPASGKTTLLRDMAYQLSNGYKNQYSKVVMVDERNEFAGKINDEFTLSLGANCDVLTGYDKAKGIEIAVKNLSPQYIFCDEISNENELEKICFGFCSGVNFVLSTHIGGINELYKKSIIYQLLTTNQFSNIVLLEGLTYKVKILKADDVLNEINRRFDDNNMLNLPRFYA